MNGLSAHSTSASSASIVPSLIWYSFISNLGPTSVSWTLFGPFGISYVWCLSEIQSALFAKVMTRLLFPLGGANRCFKMFAVRLPSAVVKFSRIKCGLASDTVPMSSSLMSCLITVLEMPKYAVGPKGMCDMTMPSGSPLCSCTTTRSVKSLLRQSSTRSGSTCAPRLIL